jgi:hypothetical protein
VLAKEETVRLVHALNNASPPAWTDITGLARHAAHAAAATAINGCNHAGTPEVAAAFKLAGMNLQSGPHGRPHVAHKTGAWRYSLQRILALLRRLHLDAPRAARGVEAAAGVGGTGVPRAFFLYDLARCDPQSSVVPAPTRPRRP